MLVRIVKSDESTQVVTRYDIVVGGQSVGLIAMPADQADMFLETLWDGHARFEGPDLHFEKVKFSYAVSYTLG